MSTVPNLVNIVSHSENSFVEQTTAMLFRLRSEFIEIISQSCGSLHKSRDMQKKLGVNLQLSWQIFRIVNAPNPIDIYDYIPSPPLMKRLVIAIKRQGVPVELIARLQAAYDAFEGHVAHYARDKATFDLMMAHLVSGETNDQLELLHRRSVFEAHRYLWGVDLDTHISSYIFHPSATIPFGIDAVGVRVKRNLQRMNMRIKLIIDARFSQRDDTKCLPIDEEAFREHGTPILPQFCSRPDIPTRNVEHPNGKVTIEWVSEDIGRPGAIDLAFSEIERGMGKFSTAEHPADPVIITTTYTTPARLSVHDLLVHRPTFGSLSCEISRWGHTSGLPDRINLAAGLNLPQLPCREKLLFVGKGHAGSQLPEVPNYTELLDHSCRKVGWKLEEMDVYRIRTEFPLMDSMLMLAVSFQAAHSPVKANSPEFAEFFE